ncbi:TPA: hypothetical protein ACH3X2_001672 [Trebouxia sp. C0005]|nr:MAG: hypothetical protein FRX49_08157 [Trebouxia sp. A1-2]
MTMLATSVQRPAFAFKANRPVSKSSVRSLRTVARGTGPGAGNSDPQKVQEQKNKKHSEGQWAEPQNKNKLEKQTLSRQGPSAQSKGLKDESAVNEEEVKQGYQDAADGAKNKVQEAGDAIAGAVDKIRPDKN